MAQIKRTRKKRGKNTRYGEDGRNLPVRDRYQIMVPDEKVKLIYRLTLLGLTDREIAAALGIDQTTFTEWKQRKLVVARAIRKGREEASGKVAHAIYKAACGYSHKDTEMFQYKGQIIERTYTKHYPPNIQAAKFWLTNKNPERWADITKAEVTQNIHISQTDLSDLTTEELELAKKLGIKALAAPQN